MTNKAHNPEELADILDQMMHDTADNHDYTDDPLVETAMQLASESHPEPSLQVAMRIQSRLLAESVSHQSRPIDQPARTVPFKILKLVASVVLVLIIFLLPSAAYASVPGELLYPVKRVLERAELTIARFQDIEADIYLRHAEHRAQESLALLERGEFSSALIGEALNNVNRAVDLLQQTNQLIPSRTRAQTLELQVLLNYVVQVANEQEFADADAVARTVEDAFDNADLLLPSESVYPVVPVPTQSPTPTVTPEEPTATETTTATHTATPAATSTLTPTTMDQSQVTTPTIVAPVTGSGQAFPRGNTAVNIRTGPGINFDRLETILPGTEVEIIGESTDGIWLQVRLPDGQVGWVASWLMSLDRPAPPMSAPPISPPANVPPDNKPDGPPDNVPQNNGHDRRP